MRFDIPGLLALLSMCSYIAARNPIIDGETRGAELLTELGAKKHEVDKMRAGFKELHLAFCSPPQLEDSKIMKIEDCDPLSKFPIGSKCREDAYQGKNPSERRKVQCGPTEQLAKLDSQIDNCIDQEIERTRTTPPSPLGISEEQSQKMHRSEFVKLVLTKVDEMRTCFVKALQ